MTTIQLTTIESFKASKEKRTYYLTSITEEQKDQLFEAKNNNKLKELSSTFGITCNHVIRLGRSDEAKVVSIRQELGFIYGPITDDKKRTLANRPIHFRIYSKTAQAQRDSAYIINLGEDAIISAKSAYKMLKEEYCCLWYKEGFHEETN